MHTGVAVFTTDVSMVSVTDVDELAWAAVTNGTGVDEQTPADEAVTILLQVDMTH